MTKKKKIVLIVVAIVILIAVVTTAIIIVNINRSKDRISGKEEESIETAMTDKEEGSTDSTSENETSETKSEGNAQSGTQSATEKPDGGNQTGTQSTTEESEGGSQTDTQTTKPNGNNQSGTQNTTEKPGGNNQSGSQNTEKTTTEAPTTESSGSGNGGGSGHQHTWEAQYKTVHHDEEGHYEKVCVQEAYDEPIYEGHYFCTYCGIDITASGSNPDTHCVLCGPPLSEDDPRYIPGVLTTSGSSYSSGRVQIGTQHHDAVYEQKWVVDQKAYDEEVLTGYKCTTCGATKK